MLIETGVDGLGEECCLIICRGKQSDAIVRMEWQNKNKRQTINHDVVTLTSNWRGESGTPST